MQLSSRPSVGDSKPGQCSICQPPSPEGERHRGGKGGLPGSPWSQVLLGSWAELGLAVLCYAMAQGVSTHHFDSICSVGSQSPSLLPKPRGWGLLGAQRLFPKATETPRWGSCLPCPSSCLLSAQAYHSPSGWQAQSGTVPVPVTPLRGGGR